jgi:hypothetical protein
MTPIERISKAIGHAIFKHDLNLSDDLFIIRSNEFDALCHEAAREITEVKQ